MIYNKIGRYNAIENYHDMKYHKIRKYHQMEKITREKPSEFQDFSLKHMILL